MSFFLETKEDVITLGVAKLCLCGLLSHCDHQRQVWNSPVIDPSSVLTLKSVSTKQTISPKKFQRELLEYRPGATRNESAMAHKLLKWT